MTTISAAVFLILIALGCAACAAFWMLPCSPGQAVAGVLLGCLIGGLLALRGACQRSTPAPLGRLRKAIIDIVTIAAFMLPIYFFGGYIKVASLPWLESVAAFFTGGMYLTLIVAPFTIGMCFLFRSLSASGSQ